MEFVSEFQNEVIVVALMGIVGVFIMTMFTFWLSENCFDKDGTR